MMSTKFTIKKNKTPAIAALILGLLFCSWNTFIPNKKHFDHKRNCVITVDQFYKLIEVEDARIIKILPSCFKKESRGDFREFDYYINIYNVNGTEYYDQFAITVDPAIGNVYYTTSNQSNYESYKAELMKTGFTSDRISYDMKIFIKQGYELTLSESKPNNKKRYSISLAKI